MTLRTDLHSPLIAGTLTGFRPLAEQIKRARSSRINLIEVRLDTFPLKAIPEAVSLLRQVRTRSRIPLIATLRCAREGGGHLTKNMSNQERSQWLKASLPHASYVDVEIKDAALARTITQAARRKKVRVIHSLHDFTPGLRLSSHAKFSALSRKAGGDIFKVAVTPRDNNEVEEFLRWGYQLPNPGKILIGMGRAGLMSRIIGFSFGSILTFGHLGTAAAPGQLSVRDLAQSIRDVYGKN